MTETDPIRMTLRVAALCLVIYALFGAVAKGATGTHHDIPARAVHDDHGHDDHAEESHDGH